MRSGSKLTLLSGILAALIISTVPGAPGAVATSTPSPGAASTDLNAQRADLEKQLSAAAGARDEAKRQLLAAQHELSSVQRQLVDTRKHLDELDAQLKSTTQTIAAESRGLDTARGQLAGLVRLAYESSDKDGFANAVLASGSFGEAIDRVRASQSITDQVAALQADVRQRETTLVDARTRLQSDFGVAQTLEQTLNDQSGRLMALVGQRDQILQQLSGPARQLAARIAGIDQQLAPAVPANATQGVPAGTPVDQTSPCGNRFAFGNCTYYVASRRCIPWLGNAYQWYSNAAAMGYAEGSQPRRGAVVVWGRGGSSPVGHVAYVEAVGPDGGVPAGSFLISEMNYKGYDVVDFRTVPIGAANILGFIYGRNG